MKIAIDESGDIGKKFWRGSSRWFVMAAVVVPDYKDSCGQTCQAVRNYAEQNRQGREMHFVHDSHEEHERFFAAMQQTDYFFVSVAIDKTKLVKSRPSLIASKRTLIGFCIDVLFNEMAQGIDDTVVLMDTNGSRSLNHAVKRQIKRGFGYPKDRQHHVSSVRFVDSRDEPLVQLADYVAGAVRHHVDTRYSSQSYEKFLDDRGKIIYLEDLSIESFAEHKQHRKNYSRRYFKSRKKRHR